MRTFLDFTSCEHFIFIEHSADQLLRTPSSAHTYRLFVVKELSSCSKTRFRVAFVAAVKSFCLSAAEKRDYEALLFIRQLLFAEFFASLVLTTQLAPPNPAARNRPLHILTASLLPIQLAASFAASSNGSRTIASLRKAWQAFLRKIFSIRFTSYVLIYGLGSGICAGAAHAHHCYVSSP